MGPLAVAGLGLGLKAAGSFFGGRSKKKQEKENKKAAVNGANIQQKKSEDTRRGRLAVGQSLLNGVPAQTGGGVNTNVAMDPALFEGLNRERTYDFGSAVPESVGGTEAFLSGLFGDTADFLPFAAASGALGPGAAGGANGLMPGANPLGGAGAGNGAITLDQLLELLGQGQRSAPPQPTPPRFGAL